MRVTRDHRRSRMLCLFLDLGGRRSYLEAMNTQSAFASANAVGRRTTAIVEINQGDRQ